ncbi:MAG: ATP-binding protein [Bacteroidales bacterium]
MNQLTTLWHKVSGIGVATLEDEKNARQLILVNRLSFVLFLMVIVIIITDILQFPEDYRHFRVPAQHLVFTLLSALFPLVLNALGKHTLAKIWFSIVPPFIFLLYPVLFGFVKEEFYFWVPYTAIALSIIPHFIFSWKRDRVYYLIPLIFCLFISLFTEEIFGYFSKSELPIESIIAQSIVFQKLGRIFIFLFLNISLAYFIMFAFREEELLKNANLELQRTNELVLQQSDELAGKNYQLKEQHEEIHAQNEELHEQQDELNVQNEELSATLEQLRYMQQQLIQSEKMASVGVLTAGIAHEINNPINFISSGVDALKVLLSDFQKILLQFEELNADNISEKLSGIRAMQEELGYHEMVGNIDRLTGNISTGVGRVTEIIRSLRIFSRLDQHELAECNLNEFLESALVLLFHQYKNRIDIQRNFGEIPVIQCNPVQINQVFVNILINAIDAIERNGMISIATRYLQKEERVEIRIRDTGAGIPQDVLPRIFEPFFTTKDVGKGTGLGLAITYSIIENHKGSILAESKPGEGTEFIISLPIKQEK